MTNLRIGHGYDVHRLTEGRALILGGVTIPYEKGLLGHSDADVLTHAVMDAPPRGTMSSTLTRRFWRRHPNSHRTASRCARTSRASSRLMSCA